MASSTRAFFASSSRAAFVDMGGSLATADKFSLVSTFVRISFVAVVRALFLMVLMLRSTVCSGASDVPFSITLFLKRALTLSVAASAKM